MLKIRLHDIEPVSGALADIVRADGFRPDAVIYLEKAGFLIGRSIARRLDCREAIACDARRPLTSAKKQGTRFIRFLPDWMIVLLRIAEVNLKLYKSTTERHVQIHGPMDPTKQYLIVDDSLDTGYSVREVVQRLQAAGVPEGSIRIAVINILSERALKPVILPHYTLHRNIHIQYPWSADSADYDAYLAEYERQKRQGTGG